MEFCSVCDNLLFLRMNEEDILEKHCKFCKSSEVETRKGICVSKALFSDDDVLFQFHQNPYLKYDPTLPRITNVSCPNPECKGDPKNQQVMYVKYNPSKMLYFYSCTHCNHTWKADEKN